MWRIQIDENVQFLLRGRKINLYSGINSPPEEATGRLPPIFKNNEAASKSSPARLEVWGVSCVKLAGTGKAGPGSKPVCYPPSIREPGPPASPPAAATPHGRPALFPPLDNTALVARHQGLRGKSGPLQPRQGAPHPGRQRRW
ncbi:uncharacterized protein LOC143844305 [Paroedura picta]|uniref:uncharacterized protein LOC143844305 n=1 Tax=Paroedura picta TaxID=143630 RepID=UPI004055C419